MINQKPVLRDVLKKMAIEAVEINLLAVCFILLIKKVM